MKKKTLWILLLSLCFGGLNFQLSSAQKFSPLFLHAKPSENGLEASDYNKMAVVIEPIAEGTKKIGLTEESIEVRCELSLRQAGFLVVPTGSRDKFLHIMVHIIGNAFTIETNFVRTVLFEAERKRYIQPGGITWRRLAAGLHGGDPEYVIQSLDENLKHFLNEYRNVNSK